MCCSSSGSPMSEPDSSGNGGAGANAGGIPHELLIDELTLRYDRADGSLQIGGHCVNDEVALEILRRAASNYETRIRQAAALRMAQRAQEAKRTQELLERTRGGRG